MTIYFASHSFVKNANGTVTQKDLSMTDQYNQVAFRKEICKEINRILSKGLSGDIRIRNVSENKVIKVITIS